MEESKMLTDVVDELNKWRHQRKILNFLMCFVLCFFFGAILRGCHLRHRFDAACHPGRFESYIETSKHVVCSDGDKAWIISEAK